MFVPDMFLHFENMKSSSQSYKLCDTPSPRIQLSQSPELLALTFTFYLVCCSFYISSSSPPGKKERGEAKQN